MPEILPPPPQFQRVPAATLVDIREYSPGLLTLGLLRGRLADLVDLPDDTPVAVQRIDDWYFQYGGWQVARQAWATYAAGPGARDWVHRLEAAGLPPGHEIRTTLDGARVLVELDDYIPGCGVHLDNSGPHGPVLCIDAHY